jgi:hypothetical protein
MVRICRLNLEEVLIEVGLCVYSYGWVRIALCFEKYIVKWNSSSINRTFAHHSVAPACMQFFLGKLSLQL